MSEQIYMDRFGQSHVLDEKDIVRPRSGAFILCVQQDHLLTILPKIAPDIYELPGGGIEAGEDKIDASIREWEEETGLPNSLSQCQPAKSWQQEVNFYAEDVDEYWHYDQIFYLYQGTFPDLFFEGPQPTPEAGNMQWMPLDQIKNHPKFHHIHAKSLAALL